MKLREYLNENKGDEKELQDMADKAEKDVNADWDPPSKKQQTLKEAKELKSLKIEIEMGNDSMKTSIDAETAIKEAFKKLRLGSGGPAFVKIYDKNENSVGFLEVK
jgi:predicted transglutaminase-like protease